MLLTGGYALIKLQFMLLRKRPDVIKFVETDAFDDTVRYQTKNNDFMIAVSAENWYLGPRVDPRYIQFIISYNYSTLESSQEQ